MSLPNMEPTDIELGLPRQDALNSNLTLRVARGSVCT
jgi:hypothetical protein